MEASLMRLSLRWQYLVASLSPEAGLRKLGYGQATISWTFDLDQLWRQDDMPATS